MTDVRYAHHGVPELTAMSNTPQMFSLERWKTVKKQEGDTFMKLEL